MIIYRHLSQAQLLHNNVQMPPSRFARTTALAGITAERKAAQRLPEAADGPNQGTHRAHQITYAPPAGF
jgi:hypothetical protein